jgi:hypothetical protein
MDLVVYLKISMFVAVLIKNKGDEHFFYQTKSTS